MGNGSMNSAMSKRFVTLGFLMTCVIVLFHCGSGEFASVSSFDENCSLVISNLFESLGPLAMSYFFAATGFLFFYGFKIKNFGEKIKRRVFSLLVPYFLWQVLFAVLYCGVLRQMSFSFSMQSIFLLLKWPPNDHLWYLYAVFLLALINPLLYFLFCNKKAGFAALICLLIIIQLIKTSGDPVLSAIYSYGYIDKIFSYLPSYLTAAYLGLHAGDTAADLRIILGFLFAAFLLNSWFDGYFLMYVKRIFPILFIYLLPDFCIINAPKLTNLSFLIYAVHRAFAGLLSNQIRVFLQWLTPSAAISNLFGRILPFIIILGISWGLWLFLSRISPTLLKLLTGGRTRPYSFFKETA